MIPLLRRPLLRLPLLAFVQSTNRRFFLGSMQSTQRLFSSEKLQGNLTLQDQLLAAKDREIEHLTELVNAKDQLVAAKEQLVATVVADNSKFTEVVASKEQLVASLFASRAETQKLILGNLEKDYLRLKNNFNLRGALEKALESYSRKNFNKALSATAAMNKLAEDEQFKVVLKQTCTNHAMLEKDVERCVKGLYHELSKHAHGNLKDKDLTVNASEHSDGEFVAIVSVFEYLTQNGHLNVQWVQIPK